MENIAMLQWVVGIGFGFNFLLLLTIWNSINKRIDRVEQRIDRLDVRLDRLEEKLTDIDRRICRLEGAFSAKDCCMIKDDRITRKVE